MKYIQSSVYSVGFIIHRLIMVIASLLLNCSAYGQNSSDYHTLPLLMGGNNAPPMVMLSMSLDHQLFFSAYNNYEDMDENGLADITYLKEVKYIGYFDSGLCYSYTDGLYSAETKANNNFYCNIGSNASNQWSGNFLNWLTMTRIDVVRKILYGGYRSIDTRELTVLERTYLPNDAHSYVKYYNGSDLGKLTPFGNYETGKKKADSGITFCNTTVEKTNGILSQNSKQPPLLRVVKGDFSFWAGGERWQCLYEDEHPPISAKKEDYYKTDEQTLRAVGVTSYIGEPNRAAYRIDDYIVRVKACDNKALLSADDCIQYSSGNYKPTGLLQNFGEKGEINFGLISGSYKKNKSGGVLRKNVGSMIDEINHDDGTFRAVGKNGGIIKSIDGFKIANWQYLDTRKIDYGQNGTYANDNCLWFLSGFNNGSCTNWGNPFAEILLETYRYFSGGKPTEKYLADDSNVSPDLGVVSWSAPMNNDNECTNLNVLAFNTSTISYDGDDLDPTDLGTNYEELSSLTAELGQLEGLNGSKFFVGKINNSDDELCTAKTINDLSGVKGTCPDASRLEGTYFSSGLAFYAKTHDINKKIDGEQNINTFGFSLAPSLPKISVARPGWPNQTINIFPACRNNDNGGNCAIVDYKIIEPHNDDDKDGIYTGLVYVSWEDSEQGADFDQDVNGLIAYELSENKLLIKTRILNISTPNKMGFGFIVSGVGNLLKVNGKNTTVASGDGFHVVSGANKFTLNRSFFPFIQCESCELDYKWSSKEFSVTGGKSKFLEAPLYYASKYGGFKDSNSNGIPDLISEWDAKNNFTGEFVSDGMPDNYYSVTNPEKLKNQFKNVLSEIIAGASSRSGAGVVTNAGDGNGLVLQSLFYPSLNYKGKELSWVGTLNALFMDEYNNVREDSDQNGTLSSADNLIEVLLDPESKTMMAQRYRVNMDGSRGAIIGLPISLDEVKTLWSATKQLANITEPTIQREYTKPANTQRHILTSIAKNNNGLITQANELMPFVADTFMGENYYLLGLSFEDKNKAANIVDYIRGKDLPDYRSRSADLLSKEGLETWRLGDISSSTPVIVGAPKIGYDVEFSDSTYLAYRNKYQDRRTVVYAAANDGMIHAFNAGSFNHSTSTYRGDTHPLGSELWAYVPYNLLPHLKWLTEFNYPHVPYLDGKMQVFDVNAFDDDADHPAGWGTILVVGMRFGGSPITVKDANNNEHTLRSGWVVLDITNPEKPPHLIAEITDKDLGFTTTNAEIVKFRKSNLQLGSYSNKENNDWFLAFGSGPQGDTPVGMRAAQLNATSTASAKIYLFDLRKKSLKKFDTGIANSFVGGIKTADWNRDFSDDGLYYGLVGGSITAPSGSLRRGIITMDAGTLRFKDTELLTTPTQAFSSPPFTRIDNDYNYWVFAGTGRFYMSSDGLNSNANSFYGLKEKVSATGTLESSSIGKKSLIDVSDIQTYTNGQVKTYAGEQVFINGSTIANTTNDVTSIVADNQGWFLNFPNNYTRSVGSITMNSTSLLFTAFTPSSDLCSGGVGTTQLYQREFFNGLSPSYSASKTDKTQGKDDDVGYAIPDSLYLGDKYYVEPTEEGLTQSNDGELKQIELGSPKLKSRRESWREINKSW